MRKKKKNQKKTLNNFLHLCASKEPLLFADENASSEAKEWAFISGAEKRKGVKVEFFVVYQCCPK